MPKFSQGEPIDIDPATDEKQPAPESEPQHPRPRFPFTRRKGPVQDPLKSAAEESADMQWTVQMIYPADHSMVDGDLFAVADPPMDATGRAYFVEDVRNRIITCVLVMKEEGPPVYGFSGRAGQEYAVRAYTEEAAALWDRLVHRTGVLDYPPERDWVVHPIVRNSAGRIAHEGPPLRPREQRSFLERFGAGELRHTLMWDPQTYVIAEKGGQEYSVRVLTGAAATFWDNLTGSHFQPVNPARQFTEEDGLSSPEVRDAPEREDTIVLPDPQSQRANR